MVEEGQIPAEPVARDFKSQQLKGVKEGEFPGSGERRASKKKKSRVSLPRQRRNRRRNESLSSPRGDGQEEEGSVSSKSVSSKSVSSSNHGKRRATRRGWPSVSRTPLSRRNRRDSSKEEQKVQELAEASEDSSSIEIERHTNYSDEDENSVRSESVGTSDVEELLEDLENSSADANQVLCRWHVETTLIPMMMSVTVKPQKQTIRMFSEWAKILKIKTRSIVQRLQSAKCANGN